MNRRSGLVESGVSLGPDFDASKAHPTPSELTCPVLVDQDGSSQLLIHYHVCLPATMLPVMIVMD